MSFPFTSAVAVRRALPVLPVLFVTPMAMGASPTIVAEVRQQGLDEVIVVATRSPVEASRIGNAVTVLDEQAIRESQAVITSDLLATLPGVGVTRTGGPGALTAVRIRGAEADHTLVLIDGVQINDPSSTGGGFDFGNLLLGDTARIEVLRGPQSTLYGSQAIGGVISILTAEPGDGFVANALAEYGSMNTKMLKGGLGYGSDRITAQLTGSWYDSDGVSAYAGGTEDDGFRNSTFGARFDYALTDDMGLDLRAYYVDGRVDHDNYVFVPPFSFTLGDTGDYMKTRQFIGHAGFHFALADGRLRNRLAVQTTTIDRDLFSGPVGADAPEQSYRGENTRYEYQGNWSISERFSAVFGAQREESGMHSDPHAPSFAEVRMDSFYLQLQARITAGLWLTAGGRHDDHQTFGSEHSPQVAAAWALPSGTILRASWGEGFKAPTLYQLYSDYGNPGLQPETSHGWDAGIEQRFLDNRGSVSATWFERDTGNQISFLSCPDPGNMICSLPGNLGFGYYYNITRTRAEGIEVGASFAFSERFDVTANYTHTKALDRSPESPDFGLQLLRRPEDTANAAATLRWPGGFSTAVAVRYVSPSFDVDDSGSRIQLDAYTLVDLRAAWRINEALEIAARVENLFDEDYEQIHNFGTPGRAGYVSLAYQF